LDAPGLVRAFVLGGVALIVLAWIVALVLPIDLRRAATWMGGSFVLTGLAMIASSRFGKLRARDRTLDALGLRGDERVLDVGCGRGLMLIGAAKRLPKGQAVGVDLWSQRDLSENRSDATLANARAEGVAERVEVVDGDMRAMPFSDASFDVVVSSFAIHNLARRDDRRRAIHEIVRVLAPGGRVAIRDLGRTAQYASDLREAGMQDVARSAPSPWTFPFSRVVTAQKRGASVSERARIGGAA
jgi:ubiquinone/menaquinone biosynthesis C-methylase UbiE